METLGTIFSALFSTLWWVIQLLWSLAWYVAWVVIWLLAPVLIVAFIGLRIAESVLGQETVRAWIKARAMTYGAGTWSWARRWTFALGVLPLRVLGWMALFTIWHAVLSIFWRPKWHPWKRAWAKRWKPVKATRAAAR